MRLLSCIVVFFATGLVWGQNDFVTTWKTDNAGTSGSTEITIPTTGSGYNYDVDWDNDGTFDEFGLTGNVTHDFGTAGTYTIRITGDFPRIYFNNGGDKDKILDVANWGDIQWTNFNSAFRGCSNLDVSATDAPDLSGVTNLFDSFRDCTSFNTSIDHWNVSTITNFGGMFEDTPYNQPLNSWITSSGTSFNFMFWNAAFNQPLDNWDMSSAQSFTQMFYLADFNQDISGWTLTSAQSMNYMFRDSDFDQDLSGWNVSNVTNMREMFRGTDCNYDLSGWDVSNVTNMRGMFRSSPYNHNLGDWNMGAVTNAQEMFNSSGMSVENYDSTLIGWSAQMLQSGVTLGATGVEFCVADEERAAMVANYSWTFDDAGQNCGTTDFAMMINTANPGTSGTTEFEIRTTGSGYDYDVDWDGDGTYDEFGLTGNTTHDYGTTGTYTVRIKGDFPRIFYNASGDKDKILSIEQWGDNQWISFANAFNNCDSLIVNATDAPDLSGVASLNSMFANCESLSNEDFSNWNTSSITNMAYMFRLSNFDGNVSTWNVSSVQNFSHMFRDGVFNGDVSGWMTTSASNFEGMFRGNEYFNQDVSGWNASGVANFGSMFNGCNVFNADVSGWNVSSATDMGAMFANCWEFDQDLSDWDVTGVTEFYAFLTNTGMSIANYDSLLIGWAQLPSLVMGEEFDAEGLRYCEGAAARDDIINNFGWTFDDEGTKCFYDDLVITVKTDNNGTSNATSFELPVYGTSIPFDIDWDNDGTYDDFGVTGAMTHDYGTAGTYTISISGEFSGLYFNNGGDKDKILSVDQWGDSEWSNAENAFYGCSDLQIAATDTFEVYEITSVAGMFRDCDLFNDDLEGWNFSNITDMSFMFADCPSFNQNVNGWNVSNVTSMESMFQNCTSLEQDFAGWNTADVVLLTNMFNGATLFDGDITKFDVDNVTDATGMLTGTSFQTHYDLLLNRWINHDVQSNVTFDVGFATYCHGEHAHDTLTMDFGWTINDGGLNCVNEAMIMTYQTDNAGVTNSSSITIPIYFNVYSCYDVDWDNDGVWDTLAVQGSYVHDFGTPGTYTIRVRGNIPFIWFGNTGDKDKIISVDQWGTMPWSSSYEAFYGCTNLQVPATDQPNFDALGGFSRFFKGCTNLNSSFNHWDVSEISGFFELFMNCDSLNQPFDNWDMSNATRLEDMFNGAESFNQSLASWDVSNVDDWDDFLTNAGISVINYDSTLISWSQLDLVDGVVADMGTSMYCAGEDARDSIIANFGWTFNDGGLDCSNLDDFVLTVNTSNNGTSGSSEFTIPTNGGFSYNYDIDWDNDGEFDDFGVTGNITHDFGAAGTYIVRIQGDFPMIYFNDGGDAEKLMEVNQWGNIQWQSGASAFRGCTHMNVTATDTIDISNATTLTSMFRDCDSLNSSNLSGWDVSSITNITRMFQNAVSFNQDLNDWDVSNINFFNYMFNGATSFNGDLSAWTTTSLQTSHYMFADAESFNQDIGGWNMINASNLSNMFEGADAFNANIGGWTVDNVTNFSEMFRNAVSFNQDIGSWNVGSGVNFGSMFRGALVFNQNIGGWNVGSATNMANMFNNAADFDQNIGSWIVSNVTTMAYMFSGATDFNQDIGGWNVTNVTNMQYMFSGTDAFNQDIGAWAVDSVTNFSYMFSGNTVFDQNIGSWNTISAENLTGMFLNCTSFDQNLSAWDVSNVQSAGLFISGGELSIDNYDALLIGWNAQNLQPGVSFHAGNSNYCVGQPDRANMIASDGWLITDAGLETIAPTPDVAALPDLVVECEVTSLTAPTATDNCVASVLVSSDAVYPITTGTTVVTWTYDDGHGNTATQTQNVIVNDVTAPVADSLVLPDVLGVCEITSLTAPTATDNCASSVTVTNDATLPITAAGTTVVTWTYDDGHGNTATQTQNVIINDAIAPVADSLALPDVLGECEITSLIAPTATDNCASSVIVTNDVTLPITAAGTTVITWTYDDGHGNTSTQTQNVILQDVTPPTASNPNTLTVNCISDVPAPNAAYVYDAADNCSATPTITWMNDVSDGLTCPETITRTYRVEDAVGLFVEVYQTIIVNDDVAPVSDSLSLTTLSSYCPVTPAIPTATDNCSGTLNGVADVAFPISTIGTTMITWTFTDDCGNTSTQTQEVIIEEIETGTSMAPDGITIVSDNNDAGVTFQWVECHNNYAPIAGETNQNFTPTYGGDFAVIVTQNGCSDTSDCVSSFVGIEEVYLNEVLLYPNPSNGNFTVQSEHAIVQMTLMDLSGRTVPIHTNLTTGEVQCELVSTGNYLLQVQTAHTTHTIEVMIR